jgi:predicted nicotinamide N-methyase
MDECSRARRTASPVRHPGGVTAVEPELVEEVVVVGGRDLVIARPAEPESLLDDEAFAREEFLPYWAELWPSARVLARRVGVLALRGARVLELGCGLGLPSLAAALAGGRVLATDWSPDAIAFAARNARANGLRVETAVAAWREPDALVARGPWDLVLGSDVLYEPRNGDQLEALLPRVLAPRGRVWLADPRRPAAVYFHERMEPRWSFRTELDPGPPPVELHELRPR